MSNLEKAENRVKQVEVAFGPNHQFLADALLDYARLLRQANRILDADDTEARATIIRSKITVDLAQIILPEDCSQGWLRLASTASSSVYYFDPRGRHACLAITVVPNSDDKREQNLLIKWNVPAQQTLDWPLYWINNAMKGIVLGIMDVAFELSPHPIIDGQVVVIDARYHEVDSSEYSFRIASMVAFSECVKKTEFFDQNGVLARAYPNFKEGGSVESALRHIRLDDGLDPISLDPSNSL